MEEIFEKLLNLYETFFFFLYFTKKAGSHVLALDSCDCRKNRNDDTLVVTASRFIKSLHALEAKENEINNQF